MDRKLNVLLVCGAGASSSFMAAKMRIAAKNRKIDLNVKARSESEVVNFIDDCDAFMIGPHLSVWFDDMKKRYGEDCAVILMKKEYYSKLDGDKAIDHLLQELRLHDEGANQ